MKALLQRVTEAEVRVADQVVGSIGPGLLVLLGVAAKDTEQHAVKLAQRVANYRMFADADGKTNLSVLDTSAAALVVSQFTLAADTAAGRRPSFSSAAAPELAEHLYQQFVQALQAEGVAVATGQFGADMQVQLINDGPMTFLLEVA